MMVLSAVPSTLLLAVVHLCHRNTALRLLTSVSLCYNPQQLVAYGHAETHIHLVQDTNLEFVRQTPNPPTVSGPRILDYTLIEVSFGLRAMTMEQGENSRSGSTTASSSRTDIV